MDILNVSVYPVDKIINSSKGFPPILKGVKDHENYLSHSYSHFGKIIKTTPIAASHCGKYLRVTNNFTEFLRSILGVVVGTKFVPLAISTLQKPTR